MRSHLVRWLIVAVLLLTLSPVALSGGVGAEDAGTAPGTPAAAQNEGEGTATATAEPSSTPEESPTATPSETVSPTAEPTAPAETATPDPTAAPVESPTEEPTAAPTETPFVPAASPEASPVASPTVTGDLSSLKVTLYCDRNPELTRIDNLGAEPIQIISIKTLYDVNAFEPIVVDRTLGAGKTVIFRSGSGATYGTILTTSFIYTNSAYDLDGAEIETSAGTLTVTCPAAPPAPVTYPSQLSLTINCAGAPETTTIKNIGQGSVTLSKLWTTWNPLSSEPFSLSKTLAPGQSITYQSGPGASTNRLTTSEIYTQYAGRAEKLYVQVSTGKKFAKTCPPGPKWIEVNLSTQYLIAWEGYVKIAGSYASTGKPGFETPTGTWYVNYKLTSQTMSGCIQGECYYVPDVPWVMYFTDWGHAIHGAYWHNDFGSTRSHGCVNLPVSFAEWLYYWTPYGTPVVIHY